MQGGPTCFQDAPSTFKANIDKDVALQAVRAAERRRVVSRSASQDNLRGPGRPKQDNAVEGPPVGE
jgi:hypothetical protein